MSTTRGGRHMAGIQDVHTGPIPRDDYATSLAARTIVPDSDSRPVTIKAADAYIAAALLDELSAIYRGEPLGRLSREIAVTLYDRLGI